MPTIVVQIAMPGPAAVNATLYYDHDFQGIGTNFDYLHMIRQLTLFNRPNPNQLEETYWSNLEQRRHVFAAGINTAFDLIVDPPSKSGYHRPFLSAFLAKYPGVTCLRLKKTANFSSNPADRAAMLAGIEHVFAVAPPLGNRQNVLIVDDVFSTGTLVSVIIEKMRGWNLPQNANITIACPLRLTAAFFSAP